MRRKGQSGGAKSDGAKQSLIMTSLRKVSLPCRQCQKESDVTLTPCGHRVVCATCALTVNFCPLCGAEVTRGQGEKGQLRTLLGVGGGGVGGLKGISYILSSGF